MSEDLAQKISTILKDHDIREKLIEVGGENAIAIIRNLDEEKDDEEFAEELDLRISDVRATLNKLHKIGIVNYKREKDSETGWYSYSWSIEYEDMVEWAEKQEEEEEEEEDEGEIYYCPSCGPSTRVKFEEAMGKNFRCENCDRMLELEEESGEKMEGSEKEGGEEEEDEGEE